MPLSRSAVLGAVLACGLGTGCATGGATRPASTPGDDGHKSYILPAVEIIGMNAGVNYGGRKLVDPDAFDVTPTSIRRNLRGPWVVDDDPFEVNQFLHPYQGAMYHGIARSNGFGYWGSMAYTFAGSALWEIAGEATPPSKNDQIASGIAGSFLGEPLFRISRLLLERADHGPGIWRVLASALTSPPTGINYALVGHPAGARPPDAVPFSDIRVQFGMTTTAGGLLPSASRLKLDEPLLGFSMDYGYPGNASYTHNRPFDYFRLDGHATPTGLTDLSTRGLIGGGDYGAGRRARGIWGLYGSYDYFASDGLLFSSTALSFGTTLQSWLSEAVALQSSVLAGAGYAAAQSTGATDEGDYHYGLTPQATANVRLIAGRRAALDLTARQYFVSDIGGFGARRRDLVFQGDASIALRLYRQHAIAVTYLLSRRAATHQALPRITQRRSTIGVFYTFLGSGGFGAVR